MPCSSDAAANSSDVGCSSDVGYSSSSDAAANEWVAMGASSDLG